MGRSIKVALLKSRLEKQGGLEKYAKQLVKAFVLKGCDVTILTTGTPIDKYPCEVISLGKPGLFSALNILTFDQQCKKWLAENPQDIVFGTERTTFQTHYRAGNGVHAAYLERRKRSEGFWKRLSFAINPLHHTILSFERKAFEDPQLERLFVNSHMVRSEVLEHYKTNPDKIDVIHNGVEWSEWQKPFDSWTATRHELLKALGLDQGCHQLLFVGHGFRRKGLDRLLHGIARTRHPSNIQLAVVGVDKEAGFFQNLASELKLNVKFFGARSDIISFYQAADALAIPSTYDPFANVTVEALAMGLFVITSKDNGGHEIINRQIGTVIENLDDPEAIADSLRIAMQHPKTTESAIAIRVQTRRYDFANQLNTIVDRTLAKR
ncbi:MAG: glycosyltransferase family 4 protein [Chlamydiales bacterium]|nr:glycosyltransferase family 4 protein [Chlamydiales bacterium]